MINFFEFKNNLKNDDFKIIKDMLKQKGIVVIKLKTDDHKTQIKQFDNIKKQINYKPDENLKFYWNNSNNFVIVDEEKFKINEF